MKSQNLGFPGGSVVRNPPRSVGNADLISIPSLFWEDPTSGWPSMVCIIMLVSGVQLFCLGVVGQYLSKTYLEVKKRPMYLVKEDI